MPRVDRITIRGFKSIHALDDFELRPLTALIGPNGSGKSNLLAVFRMLSALAQGRFQLFVRKEDGPDALLFGGRKRTAAICARAVLDGLERKGRCVFPAPEADRPRSANWLEYFWTGVRVEAELEDVHLHDLRHTVASLALRQGETVLAIGRLLGHRKAETTLKYIHLADSMVQDAAETIGAALEG